MTKEEAISKLQSMIIWGDFDDKTAVEMAIEALDRPTGHWIEAEDGMLKCSRCGRMSDCHDECIPGEELEKEFCEIIGGRPKYIFALKRPRYCWNCGARMD